MKDLWLMDTTKECISILKDNAPDIKKLFGVKSLCLFGSFSRNEQRDDSDVDVFVEMEPKIFIMVRLKRFLEEKPGRSVDVIRNHNHINPQLLNDIKRDGISII